MSKEVETYNPTEESIVVYRSADNAVQLDVQLADETVWLTQAQMAELYQKDRTVITRHINNIFADGELDEKSNVQNLHFPNSDKPVKLYNLDVIISVGYRVKNQRGVQFRRWANRKLKEYILRGYAINQQLLAMQRQLDSRFEQQDSRMMAIEKRTTQTSGEDRFLCSDQYASCRASFFWWRVF